MELTTGNWITILVYVVSFAATWGSVTQRLKVLEQKQDKHNNLIERMAIVEASTKSAHHRIDGHENEDHCKDCGNFGSR